MRVFGHKEADKCRTDLEIPLAPLSSAAADRLAGINAMNLAKTPIAESLELTAADLRTVTGERVIVLVTDGEETCDGDPAAAIAGLRAQGHNLRVSIVGYAIDDDGLRDTFARWAKLGGGEYFDAAGELWKTEFFREVQKIQGHPTATHIRMENKQEGGSSELHISDVRYDVELADALFDSTALAEAVDQIPR